MCSSKTEFGNHLDKHDPLRVEELRRGQIDSPNCERDSRPDTRYWTLVNLQSSDDGYLGCIYLL